MRCDFFTLHKRIIFFVVIMKQSFIVFLFPPEKKHVTLVANRCVAIVIDDSRIPDGWWMQINCFFFTILVFVIQKGGQGVSNIIPHAPSQKEK